MTYLMTSAYAAAYATARSSLAALADQAAAGESGRYARALLKLDRGHQGVLPATYPLVGSRRDLLFWLEGAVEHMIVLGGDPLSLELVLASAAAI